MRALVRWTAWMVWATLLLGTQAAVAQTSPPTSADALVEQYYENILGRASDAGGKAYWLGEASRATNLNIDVKEAFMVLAGQFFASSEYVARNRDDAGYVSDLYQTFFNRAPDSGGLAYWTGLLAGGVSRAVVMNGFLFSPEFAAYMANLPGSVTSRPEIYASVDFYRGLMNRLPDNGGFNYWLNQFQISQCNGAGMVYGSVESISSSFVALPEYVKRNRSDTEYVSDLYYAFLRRSADQPGFQYWVDQLTKKLQTRDQLRKAFIASPEFTGRVNAIISTGCVPKPDPCNLTTTVLSKAATDVPAACGTTPTPADGSCDVTLTLVCTGGAPTSYGWSSTASGTTLSPGTSPPVSSQKVTVTTPQTFTAAGSNASGTATSLPVLMTVGGSSVGSVGSGAVDCSLQGFGTVHYTELTLNQAYTMDTSWFGTAPIHIPPDTIKGTNELVVIKFTMPPGQRNLAFHLSVVAYPAFEADVATTMVWSTKPCDWDGSDKSASHFGLQQSSNSTQSQYYVIGGPDETGLGAQVLPGGGPLYLIISNRYSSTLLPYYMSGDWTCPSGRTCNKRIAVSLPGVL